MLDFLATYWSDILAGVVAVAGAVTSVCALAKTIKTNAQTQKTEETTKEEIAITKEGIVQAFKQAKIPNELKLDISNKVSKILTEFEDKILTEFRENETLRTNIVLYCIKIMVNTAAYNKLTDTEKEALDELMKQIDEEDKTVDLEDTTEKET